jgi:parallel beta-helix repeat protein
MLGGLLAGALPFVASSSLFRQATLGSALPHRMPASHGQVFYVDGMKGRNRNRGTKGRPWRTIQHALDRVPLNGSVIVVRAGTYAGENIWHRRNGKPDNPVTLRPYTGEHVTLTGVERSEVPAIWVRGGGAIRIRGFEIAAHWGDGIRIENSNDVEVVGCNIHNSGQQGILVVGTGSTSPTGNRNIQLWANRFHDNGGAYISKDSYWIKGDHGVYWGAASDNDDGIDHTTVGGVIANNLFYNQPYGRLLQLGSQVDGTIVTNNTFYGAYQPDPDAGDGVVFYGENNQFATRKVLLVNNIIADSAHNGVDGSALNDRMRTNLVRNNLAWQNPGGDFIELYGSHQLFTLEPGNITGKDPLLTNPKALDFRPRLGSPAGRRSITAYTPATDFTGRPRKQRPDLGALEILPQHRTS